MFDRAFYNPIPNMKYYHYKMVSSKLWNTFIPDTMKSKKNETDYLKEINQQMQKTIPEQLEDLKVAVAQLCVAMDKVADSLSIIRNKP